MKKNILLTVFIFSLLLSPCYRAAAQTNDTNTSASEFPQWVRDLRRVNIISFGLFPFSMFFTTFFTDMYRWNNANGMNFSEEGRRYAPWPFKSAGAVEMTTEEYQRTILMAAGLSVTVALVDLLIVNIKRSNERRRIEGRPVGSVVIERIPLTPEESDEPELIDDENIIENITEE